MSDRDKFLRLKNGKGTSQKSRSGSNKNSLFNNRSKNSKSSTESTSGFTQFSRGGDSGSYQPPQRIPMHDPYTMNLDGRDKR